MTSSSSLALLAGLALGCTAADAPAPTGDPIGFTFESAAGSLASFGWTGAVHGVTGPAGTPFGVEVTACDHGVCRFQGPTDPGGQVNRRRCLFRMSRTCTTDDECPVDGGKPTPCVYIYDAPISQPLVGEDKKIGACAWTYIPIHAPDGGPTISGTLNLTTGALNLENLTVLLPLNGDGHNFHGACGECVRDKTPNDGIRDGVCEASIHLGNGGIPATPDDLRDRGMPCDVNRGGMAEGFEGNYSMDCSPTVIRGVNPPLAFGGAFTSSGIQVSLDDASPNCSASGIAAGKCFCGTCQGTTKACMSADQCGGAPCVNPTEAECMPAIPADLTPENMLHVNQCKSDRSRFAVYSSACAGPCAWDDAAGSGTCMRKDGKPTRCYPTDHGIVVEGHAERDDHVGTVYRVNTGSASCIPDGGNAAVTAQLGLPGLLFQKRNFQIIPTYAKDQP